MAVLSVPAVLAAADAPGAVTLTGPSGAVFAVDETGLASIRCAGREVARGGLHVFNGETWFRDSGTKAVRAGAPQEKSVRAVSERAARVRHAAGDVVADFDYALDGEDLHITVRVENNHPAEFMNIIGLSGLLFTFDRPPRGIMQTQHISYFQAHGAGLMHPSHWSRIGGSCAADETVGVGISPWNTGLMRTLILWDYASWAADRREKDPQRRLLYFASRPVPPRGSATIELMVRVSPTRDWKHLLEPYRRHFRATFGPVRYRADLRWIATDYLNHSQRAISPTNPYGFHGGHRRMDTADGAQLFCDTLIPALRDSGSQGVIVWGQSGDDPRGGMYRPDFDVLPPEVQENLPRVIRRFAEAGLKFGVTTRPRHIAVRADWKQDGIIDISPDDAGHRAMLWRRFENMIGMGCRLFYLDSFGDSLEDVKLMRFLRDRLGPEILTFAEHQCDAMLPLSGGYSETTFRAAEGDRPASYALWSGLHNWEIYQWLCPGAQMAARLYQVQGKITDADEQPDAYFFRNRITPLVPWSGDRRRLALLATLQPQYLGDDGLWRGGPTTAP